MTQYLLSVWHASDFDMTSEAAQASYEAVDVFNQKIVANGHFVFAGGLAGVDAATVVRSDSGAVTVTDGPYAEIKENMGGFWVINAADLDEALALAKEATVACAQPVEVRPFQEEPSA